MDANHRRQPPTTVFGVPVFKRYGVELGVLLLITITVIIVSVAYRVRLSRRKSKNLKILKNKSGGGVTASSNGSPASSDFHENGQYWSATNGIIEDPSEPTVPLNWEQLSEQRMLQKSKDFYEFMSQRRSVRNFSKEKMPRKIIENIIMTAGTSPSGANQQPWTFVLIEDPEMKATIRQIVEAEEKINYRQRMGERWVEALRHLNVNWIKPYLTDAPYILLVFKQTHSTSTDGTRQIHYYSELGTPIASGILLTAIHNAGLVTTVSTPLNCGQPLCKLLERPADERLLFLMPIGYPAIDCTVPAIKRKSLDKIYVHH